MTIALFWLLLLCCIAIFHGNVKYAPFDLTHTLPLRGILATLVVIGHLDNVISGQTKILMPFHMATPAVAVFFFYVWIWANALIFERGGGDIFRISLPKHLKTVAASFVYYVFVSRGTLHLGRFQY